jgi:hypothetical protein
VITQLLPSNIKKVTQFAHRPTREFESYFWLVTIIQPIAKIVDAQIQI